MPRWCQFRDVLRFYCLHLRFHIQVSEKIIIFRKYRRKTCKALQLDVVFVDDVVDDANNNDDDDDDDDDFFLN